MRRLHIGVNAYFHDSALAVMESGRLLFAAQEERYSRVKFDNSAPRNALRAALDQLGVHMNDISGLAYFEDPVKKLERLTCAHSSHDRLSALCKRWDRLHLPAELLSVELGCSVPIKIYDHHKCHAAFSYFSSGFADALVMVCDGVGEWDTFTAWSAEDGKLEKIGDVRFPVSLGLFYAAMTAFLGLRPNADEYKMMGMAPYGTPRFLDKIGQLLSAADGHFTIDLSRIDVFDMRNSTGIAELLGQPARLSFEPLKQIHFDIAASVQIALEQALLSLCTHYKKLTGHQRLCLGGGVSLNCVANAKIRDSGLFQQMWVPPAVDDPGNAIGAAYLMACEDGQKPAPLVTPFLGSSYSDGEVGVYLNCIGACYTEFDLEDLYDRTASLLADGKVIGWFQGRAEFGARALGARSILADPRRAGMRDHVNAKIKHRESFRPFAPICLLDRAHEFFLSGLANPFMTSTVQTKDPSSLPAVTHIDGSARLQTVDRNDGSMISGVLTAFEAATGVPLLLNTSFNLADEPIVGSPADAFNTFRESDLDVLVIGRFLLHRSEQPTELLERGTFERIQLARYLSPLTHHTYFFS